MIKQVSFLLRYWLVWIFLFFLGRLFFFFVTRREANQADFQQHWQSLFYGLRMDASVATYILLPVALIVLIKIWWRKFPSKLIIKWYTGVVLVLASILFVADAQTFKFWGYRADASLLSYLNSPKEAFASTSQFPLLQWAVLLLAFVIISIKALNAFTSKNYPDAERKARWITTLAIVVLLGVAIIPLRGGIQLAPINQSSVYFSDNNYGNQSALNPLWNFAFSVKRNREVTDNPYRVMSSLEAENLTTSLLAKSTMDSASTAVTRKNVILVVWESFTAKVVDSFYNGVEITPGFNRLKKEGIWFSEAYATGDRTDKGIVGILSGYPAQPIASIVKNPEKTRTLPNLSKEMRKAGYHTEFYYGGEMEFANIKSYLLEGNFNRLVDVNAFPKDQRNSKWGAHDGIVKDSFTEGLRKFPKPFFATWLTLSSHEPYETPVKKVIEGNEILPAFLNSLHYTDGVVSALIEHCKLQPWWNNTILVVIADHGHRYPLSSSEFDNFRIPVLILGGGISAGVRSKVISQTGLPSTLLSMNGIGDSTFAYSRNWLTPWRQPWAFFSFNNGFGYTKGDSGVVYDNVGQKIRPDRKLTGERLLNEGRVFGRFFLKTS